MSRRRLRIKEAHGVCVTFDEHAEVPLGLSMRRQRRNFLRFRDVHVLEEVCELFSFFPVAYIIRTIFVASGAWVITIAGPVFGSSKNLIDCDLPQVDYDIEASYAKNKYESDGGDGGILAYRVEDEDFETSASDEIGDIGLDRVPRFLDEELESKFFTECITHGRGWRLVLGGGS